ncbi:hypothetical protein AC579_5740 [Pseudocercospora musae]|uniref:Uncharacterized protein n=1 Tax=Pseudocercospora musae TaxID=113226 RepID=A0A139IS84_9PEZI|nr:hypothetical protein AC579_5740 [Pseudocercospora musae]
MVFNDVPVILDSDKGDPKKFVRLQEGASWNFGSRNTEKDDVVAYFQKQQINNCAMMPIDHQNIVTYWSVVRQMCCLQYLIDRYVR